MVRTPRSSEIAVDTAEGQAVVQLTGLPGDTRGAVVLGHGAGGGVQAPDLLATRAAAVEAGWAVALVTQPWKVAGRRVATPPPRLDAAWLDVVRFLLTGPFATGPLVLGGRSAGARVACRTAAALGAAAVCCLAFPLHPPGRPERSRAPELATGVPTLVVQGRRDAFGRPEDVSAVAPANVRVVAVDGDHALKADPRAAAHAVVDWLARVAEQRPGRPVF